MNTVLIIDDEKDILDTLSSVLNDEGFSVIKATDGKAGLELFQQEKPDIVLLDVWMPEMDGLQVLDHIRNNDENATVIVISGHGTISTAVEAVKMGAYDFLEKPLHIDKVLEVINRGLAGESKKDAAVDDAENFRFEPKKGVDLYRQRTLRKSTVVYGVGLHSGAKTGMILMPLPPGSGIVFEHVPDGERIPAYIDYVYSVGYASTVKGKNCVVRTIEHLMATCHMFGITNLLVKVSEEVPIFDGSAIEMCQKIKEVGVVDQKAGIEPLRIDRTVTLSHLPGNQHLSIEPSDMFEVDYTLDHAKPIGFQRYRFSGNTEDFINTIAQARTFGFIRDFEKLSSMGLASGGRINNVIILSDEDVINTKLRYEDEFVRHKILDVIGDLYLLNRPVIGKVIAKQTGHMENIALMKELKKIYSL